ncbi:hypothetical protein K4K54_004071 [Colletotrichum sp. SAR 10_86]|nr:hypothetical protein K4K51_001158 [Colletotrichum sp. SAR 10_75]KAI8205192.1 hypothetical protein K4K52_004438 [Colletotrichum sp. SAR 10_76]KAI8226099.1 hypothetical protein K4K54_004071 [Colletotrichum sp. SAR 10_86]KAJ4997582.1 hypothetical protein K4K48_006753 [Colletotrichum sp. SAR 10_66]
MQEYQVHQSEFSGFGRLDNQAGYRRRDRRQSTSTEGHLTNTSSDTCQELRGPTVGLADMLAEINQERLEFGKEPLDEQQEMLAIKVFQRAQRLPKSSSTIIHENTDASQPVGTAIKDFLDQQKHREEAHELREKRHEEREKRHEEREKRHEEREKRREERAEWLEFEHDDEYDLVKLRLNDLEKRVDHLDRVIWLFAVMAGLIVIIDMAFIIAIKDVRRHE